jgi:Reverse transcriptase (RNA-dependent DNA polymerase)
MDSFPLPRIDQLVDSTYEFAYLSFMNVLSGYNKIMMNPDDEEKTAFIIDQGLFCYRVISFDLRNADATYQRMVNTIFEN